MTLPQTLGPTRGPLVSRLFAALTLQRAFYREAADEKGATGPAAAVLCLIALLRESVALYKLSQVERLWTLALFVVVALALLSWLLYSGVAWATARLAAPQPVAYARLLRCLAFAQAPTALLATAHALEPSLYLAAHVILIGWAFAGMTVGLRAAAAVGTLRAAGLAVPAFLAQQLLLGLTSF
jgi:hypothetical protein